MTTGMSLQKIEDLHELPVVGKFYLVPCVWALHKWQNPKPKFWPVIGSWHDDHEFGQMAWHFHFDYRFYSEKEYAVYGQEAMRFVEGYTEHTNRDEHDPAQNHTPLPVVYRRLKCRRQMPDFPYLGKIQRDLIPIYAPIKLACMKCPHRGMDLSQLPVRPDGTVVCNGHGLQWNLTTGRLVMRSSKEKLLQRT